MRDAVLQFDIYPGKNSEIAIVRLIGPFTLLNLFEIQLPLRQIEAKLTILDFEQVPYMDSAGLGAVVNLYVSAGNRGRKIALAGVSQRVMSLFEQTKVNQVLSFFPTVASAEASS